MTMGFCMVQKRSILTPLKLSFSLVFFTTVTDAEMRPDSRGLRHSADPLSSNRRMLDGGSCVGIILHVDAIRSSEH